MKYNIVTNYKINQLFKQRSKYYKVDLGQAITLESRSGDRELNLNDKFAFVYNTHYKNGILRQGSIGDITFYTDHQIFEDKLQIYIDVEEFIYPINFRKLEEVGIDAYLGELLKISDEKYDEIIKEQNQEAEIDPKVVDQKIKTSPGSVNYEEIKAYIESLRNKQKS